MSLPVWSPTPEHSTDRFNVRWLNEDKDICDVAPQVVRQPLDSNRRATPNLGSLSVSESAPCFKRPQLQPKYSKARATAPDP